MTSVGGSAYIIPIFPVRSYFSSFPIILKHVIFCTVPNEQPRIIHYSSGQSNTVGIMLGSGLM